MCMRVDLPEPEGPMIAVKRPAGNPTVMPSSARTAASPSPYTRTTSAADTSRGSDTFMTGSVAKRTGARRYGCPYAVP